MSLINMSNHSAFAHPSQGDASPLDSHVSLQLQFRGESSGIGEVFSCQFIISQGVWDKTELGAKLLANPAGVENLTGIISLREEQFNNGGGTDLHFMSLFDRSFEVAKFGSNDRPHLALNVKARVISVERRRHHEETGAGNTKVWLVRVEILSGGITCSDANFDLRPIAFLNSIVWPGTNGDQLRGLFFTDSELQIDVEDKFEEKRRLRRFRLLDVTRDETGLVSSTLWEQTFGRKLSVTPLELQAPGQTIHALMLALNTQCNQVGINLLPVPTAGRPNQSIPGRIIARINIDRMNADRSTKEEFLSTGITVRFNWKGAQSDWQPKTIFVGKDDFRLIDTDEVVAFIRDGLTSDISLENIDKFATRVSWTDSTPIVEKLPDCELVGSAIGRTIATRDLWFQAGSKAPDESAFVDQPISWAHVVSVEPNGLPATESSRIDALQKAGLNSPIFLRLDNLANWTCQIIPSRTAPEAKELKPRPKIMLQVSQKGKNANLVVFQSDVVVRSPEIDIYDRPITDPHFVPNEREPQKSTNVTTTSLQFEQQAGFSLREGTVRCKLTAQGVQVDHSQRAMELFWPATRALVDPVSVTAGNLVARQTVAFRLLELDRKKPSEVVLLDSIVREKNSNIAELKLKFSDTSKGSKSIADSLNKLLGFFIELVRGEESEAEVSTVVRLKSATNEGDSVKVVVEVSSSLDLLLVGKNYSMNVGPTRLALPRDVNHGLIPIGLRSFRFAKPSSSNTTIPVVSFELKDVVGTEVQSVLALHPWSEWGPRPGEWLSTGRVRLHHRNLIQEHAEFESSFEDRFPPEGPAANADGSQPSPLLPLDDFLQAVRDRYTEASGNLKENPGKQVANWLPGAVLKDNKGDIVINSLAFADSEVATPLPSTTLDRKDLFPGEPGKGQSLKLRKNGELGADKQWLDVGVRVESLGLDNKPELLLRPTNVLNLDSRRALNSSVPLLFNRHEISALALAVQGETAVMIWGSPTSYLQIGRYTGANLEHKEFKSDYFFSSTAALSIGGQVYVGAVTNTGDLKILKVGDPNPLVVIGVPNKIKSIVAGPSRGLPRFVVIAEDVPRVFVIESTGGNHAIWKAMELPKQDSSPHSIALTATSAGSIVVAGCDKGDENKGEVIVWRNASGNWEKDAAPLPARKRDSEILSIPKTKNEDEPKNSPEQQIRKILPDPNSIRSLGIVPMTPDSDEFCVVGGDGTRALTVWKIKKDGEIETRIDWRGSEATAISVGRVHDIERRGGEQVDLDFLAIGYRSGEIEVRGLQEGELKPIRSYDAPAPILSLAVIQAPDKQPKAPSLVSVGLPDGNVLVWDLRSGLQLNSPPRITPSHYYDGLGVTREVSSLPDPRVHEKYQAPLIERLRSNVEGAVLKSITVNEFVLSKSKDDTTTNVTDIRFWCDSLKIDETDKPSQKAFDDDRWYAGRYGFYSQVRVPAHASLTNDTQNLRTLDYLPRLCGIPMFVVRLDHLKTRDEKIKVDENGIEKEVKFDWIDEVQFDAVLVNPDEVAAGFDAADEGTIPGYVRQALSRGSVITVKMSKITLEGKATIELDKNSQVDWTFAVNRQRPRRDLTAGFPGSIAQIKSTLGGLRIDEDSLKIKVDLAQSSALVFDRLWPLVAGQIELTGSGRFVPINPIKESDESPGVAQGWEQFDFEMRSPELGAPVDKPLQVFPTANSEKLVAIKDSPFAWDTISDSARFIAIATKDPAEPKSVNNRVMLVDRITGLADPGTSRFIGANFYGEEETEFTSVAINETDTQVTIAAARKGTSGGEGVVEFYFDPDFDAYAQSSALEQSRTGRLRWKSKLLAGESPIVSLSSEGPEGGDIVEIVNKDEFPRLELDNELTSPLPGGTIELIDKDPKRHSAIVLTHVNKYITLAGHPNWGEQNTIATATYFQPVCRISNVRSDDQETKFSVDFIEPLLKENEYVEISTDQKPLRVKVLAVNDKQVTIGKTDEVKMGARAFHLRSITGGEVKTTLSIQTDTTGLEAGSRLRMYHLTEEGNQAIYLAGTVQEKSVDLYKPTDITAPADPTKFYWRPVTPISKFLTTEFAGLEITAHGIAPGTTVRVSEVQVASGTPLNRDWIAIPQFENPTDAVLLTLPKEATGDYTTGGTWTRKSGGDVFEITGASNPGPGKPIVISSKDDHALKSGELISISNVGGNDEANGDAIVIPLADPKEFAIYSTTPSPTTPTGGRWERLDEDFPVVAARRITSTLRLESTARPTPGQSVRLIDNGIDRGIVIAIIPTSSNGGGETTWDTATSERLTEPLPDLKNYTWHLPTPIEKMELSTGPDVRTIVHLRSKKDALSFGRSLLLMDDKGVLLDSNEPAKRLVASPIGDKTQQLLEELKALALELPSSWKSTISDIRAVVCPGSGTNEKRLLFGKTPSKNSLEPFKIDPPGSTDEAHQNFPISLFGSGRCGPAMVAVTVDGSKESDDWYLRVWSLENEIPDIPPSISIKSPKGILGLAVRSFGPTLIIAVSTSAQVFIYNLSDPFGPEEKWNPIDLAPEFHNSTKHHLSLCADLELPMLVFGCDKEANVVAWRLDITKKSATEAMQFATGSPVNGLLAGTLDRQAHILVRNQTDNRVAIWGRKSWLHFSSKSNPEYSPQVALEVNMDFQVQELGKINARLTPARDVQFSFNDKVAHARLLQDIARCFTLDPTSANAARGQQTLVLWPAGDLTPDATSNPLQLGAMHSAIQQSKVNVKLKLGVVAGEATLDGAYVSVEVKSSLGKGDPVYHRSTTLIANGKLGKDRLTIILEGTSKSLKPLTADFTGTLLCDRTLADKSHRFQATVRAKITFQTVETASVELEDDTFWIAAVVKDDTQQTAEATILLPSFITKNLMPPNFAVSSFEINNDVEGAFVRLRIGVDSLKLYKYPEEVVPLIPDLELDKVIRPLQKSNQTVRLSHRLRAGLAIRPDLPIASFERIASDKVGNVDWSLASNDRWLLEPVVNDVRSDGPLMRIRPEGWLLPSERTDQPKRATDGLLVAVRLPSALSEDSSFLVSIDSRTHTGDEIPVASLDPGSEQRYRQLLLDTGLRGVTMQYRIVDHERPDFAFVESPFFENSSREVQLSTDVLRLGLANQESDKSNVLPILDRLLVLPSKAAFELQLVSERYTLDSAPVDSFADVCCLAHRTFRLRRSEQKKATPYSSKHTPVLHLSATPAFRQSAPLLPPAGNNWRRTPSGPLGPLDGNHVFFPPLLDWTLAADKPGAMFQTLIQARVQSRAESAREPVLDFAQREPQFIRLDDCVTAAVAWKEAKILNRDPTNDRRLDLRLRWEETIGSTEIDVADSFQLVMDSQQKFAIKGRPLQLIESFNGDVIAIQPADAAVPAYRVVPQPLPDRGPNDPVPKPAVQPADTYLVANKKSNIFGAQKISRNDRKIKITPDTVEGIAKVATVDIEDLDGEVLTLSGRRVRVIRSKESKTILAEETLRINFSSVRLEIKLTTAGGDEVTCEAGRKGTMEYPLTLLCEADAEKLKGAVVSLPEKMVANARTGTEVTKCICWVEGKLVTLLVPLTIDNELEQFVTTTPIVIPFFEASPRKPKVKIDIESKPLWLGALRINLKQLEPELSIADKDWIRCDSAKHPEATGIFYVLPVPGITDDEVRQLVRPSIVPDLFELTGESIPVIGELHLMEGQSLSVGKANVTSVDLKDGLPAEIKVEDDNLGLEKLKSGSAVSVVLSKVNDTVREGTPLDGVWIIESVDNNGKFRLFAASAAPPREKDDGAQEVPVIVSRVSPLTSAFSSLGMQEDHTLAKLDSSVCSFWTPNSRPLLQVQWAGVQTLQNDSGSGPTPRQGGLLIPLYEEPKQVKFLANSQLPPKLSFVLSAGNNAGDRLALQRTILFGDSAPPFAQQPSISKDKTNSLRFVLKIPNNTEQLSVQLPTRAKVDGAMLFIVKSLPSGVLVYDAVALETS
ncbi:MAG: hypothetical protein JNK90_03305 [Planctomycetaceae bacterium]|nr:hypothetical protein [Planctomycetaceae bacterium]